MFTIAFTFGLTERIIEFGLSSLRDYAEAQGLGEMTIKDKGSWNWSEVTCTWRKPGEELTLYGEPYPYPVVRRFVLRVDGHCLMPTRLVTTSATIGLESQRILVCERSQEQPVLTLTRDCNDFERHALNIRLKNAVNFIERSRPIVDSPRGVMI